jgi:hypothetical protein
MNDENPGTPGSGDPSPSSDAPQGSRSTIGGSTPAQTEPQPSEKGSGKFAVYDTRYEKFVGDVVDTNVRGKSKPSKADAKKLAGHDDVEVREV